MLNTEKTIDDRTQNFCTREFIMQFDLMVYITFQIKYILKHYIILQFLEIYVTKKAQI